jgi:hypothetical protein
MTLALIAITIALLLSVAVVAAVQPRSDQQSGPRPFAALHLNI